MKLRILFLTAALLALSGCYSLAADITPPPGYVYTTPLPSSVPTEVMYFPLMAPDPQTGALIYADKCIDCHGAAGLGDGPDAADLPNPVAPIGDPDLAMDRTPEDWFRMVTNGNIERYMPPFTSLTERERWDVVAYALTLSVPPDTLAVGEAVYTESCAECHGPQGAGDGPGTAQLPGPVPDLSDQSLMAERSINDLVLGLSHPDADGLEDFSNVYTPAEQAAAAYYIRSLTFESAAEAAAEPDLPPTEPETVPEDSAGEAPEEGEGAAGDAGDAGESAGDPAGDSADGEQEEDQVAEAGPEEVLTTASVTGQVSNLSGAELAPGTEVTLYGFDDFAQVYSDTRTIGDDGTFTFDEVEMPEGRAFLAAVDYQRGTYTSDLAVAGAAIEPIFFEIVVYESTTDTSGLSIDRLHVFFEFMSADTVRVAELILITNPGEKVVIAESEGEPTVTFDLPEGAENVQFEDGALGTQYVMMPDGGFGDLRGISPGVSSHQILFSFDMPFDRSFSLDQTMELPVNALVVLLPEVGVEVAGDALVAGGERDIDGRTYQLYTGGSLGAGSPLPIELRGTPDFGTGLVTGSSGDGISIGLTAFGVVLIVVGIWFYRRRSVQADQFEERLEEEEPLPEHIEAMSTEDLMDAIIALDDRFKAGDLPEGAYLKQRGLLKQRLQEMMAAG